MAIHKKLADDIDEVDIIIAGGGTAGCVIAGRIAEAQPDLSILVIEGGSDNKGAPHVENPLFFLQNLLPATKSALFYKANKSKHLADREVIVPAGGILGGGSSINFMMYTRAQGIDFDSWNTDGWRAKDMVPFLNKMETHLGPGNKDDHGHEGPIKISNGGYRDESSESEFLRAAGECGFPEIEDVNNLENNNGFQRWLRYVCPDGKRQDAASMYVHPKLASGKAPNLHVLVESKVVKVLFDENKRANGVQYTPNPEFQAEIGLSQHPVKTVKARKLVVVTCGACGSAPVLERSGVGAKSVLEKAGVEQIVDLPGVGHDYQDHHLVLYPYKTNLKPEQTIDEVLSGRRDAGEMIQSKDKKLGWNGIDISGKLRIPDDKLAKMSSEFQEAWAKDFKDQPKKPVMLCGVVSGFLGDPASVPAGQYITTGTYTAYPYSRGHVHITGSSHDSPLDFDAGFLSDKNDIDLEKQVWAYKMQREVMRRTNHYRGELAAGHPAFPEGSAAAIIESIEEPLKNVKDIEYSKEDDEAIKEWIRGHVETTWHSLGTCKMAPKEENGVVDASLNVHGVKGLKVADLSIPPENVGGNTNNTALVIGEKAASIILSELQTQLPVREKGKI